MPLSFETRQVMTANIYVPREGTRLHRQIAPRSGIVGVQDESGLTIYFEGNLNGAENLDYYAERVKCAAGRLFMNYPTVARLHLPPLVCAGEEGIGEVCPTTGELILVGEVVWMPWRQTAAVNIQNTAAVAAYWNRPAIATTCV